MKKLLFILLLPVLLSAQTLLDSIHFDGSQTTVNSWAEPRESGDSDADSIESYVSSDWTQAIRTSHHDLDDGGDDLIVVLGSIATETSLYVGWRAKYESAYNASCNPLWNVKWLWFDGSQGHTELIWQYGNTSTEQIVLNWQLSGSVAGWASGVTKSSGWFGFTWNEWHTIEIYIEESSSNGASADGTWWVKVDGVKRIEETGVTSGDFASYSIRAAPHIKASCQPSAGAGWWQLDEWTAYDDSISTPSGADNTAPTATLSLVADDDVDSADISITNISADLDSMFISWSQATDDSTDGIDTVTVTTDYSNTVYLPEGYDYSHLYVKLKDDSSNVNWYVDNHDSLRYVAPASQEYIIQDIWGIEP